MKPIRGGDTSFKLGQKQVPSPPDFGRMTITNIYLSPAEYVVLAHLDAFELHKRRDAIAHGDRKFSIDVFEGKLAGLVLAETGFDTAVAMDQRLDLPSWLGPEISKDSRFTGGALAGLTSQDAAELLREITAPQP